MSNRLLYLVTVLIWGSTWIAIEFQLGAVAPAVSVFYRYLFAAALLFAWCRVRGLSLRFGLRAHASFASLGIGGIALLTAAIALWQGTEFTFDWSTGYVTSLAYLTLFGSIIGFGSYLTLLGRIGSHKAGYVMVMFPVVALVISVLFEDLQLSSSILAGVILVLAGNVLILRGARPDGRRVRGLSAATIAGR